MRVRLGLDQPLIVQYVDWLWDMLRGDLGDSTTYRTPALAVILQRLVPTAYLMVGGVIMAVAIAVPGGVLAAIHNNTKWDHLATGFVIFGITVPTFWLALVAILVFAVYLGWLPAIGYAPPQKDFVRVPAAPHPAHDRGGPERRRHGPAVSASGLSRTDEPGLRAHGPGQGVERAAGAVETRPAQLAHDHGDGGGAADGLSERAWSPSSRTSSTIRGSVFCC